jgi:hypothetical protein
MRTASRSHFTTRKREPDHHHGCSNAYADLDWLNAAQLALRRLCMQAGLALIEALHGPMRGARPGPRG